MAWPDLFQRKKQEPVRPTVWPEIVKIADENRRIPDLAPAGPKAVLNGVEIGAVEEIKPEPEKPKMTFNDMRIQVSKWSVELQANVKKALAGAPAPTEPVQIIQDADGMWMVQVAERRAYPGEIADVRALTHFFGYKRAREVMGAGPAGRGGSLPEFPDSVDLTVTVHDVYRPLAPRFDKFAEAHAFALETVCLGMASDGKSVGLKPDGTFATGLDLLNQLAGINAQADKVGELTRARTQTYAEGSMF